jgi:hypothetical protein
MKRIALALIGAASIALGACEGTSDTLSDGRTGGDGTGTAGNETTTFDHSNDPGAAAPGADFQPPDPAQVKVVGSPEITARLHACGKLSVTSLGNILTSRGFTGGGTRPTTTPASPSGQAIFAQAATPPALGAANYNGRVPEAPFASTSAMSKMFDIFTMSSYDAVASNWAAPACPGVKVIGTDGKFTKDGLSCLMGKPARDEHLAIANDSIAKNPTDGAAIAIAAVLSAAHTCQ